jgi:hypothetical protein
VAGVDEKIGFVRALALSSTSPSALTHAKSPAPRPDGACGHAPMNDALDYPRFASRGRSFVYVLPCRDEDLLKVGFSRDPLQRLRTLHPRFFTLFDLDRALLLETERVSEARRIERLLITRFAEQRATAPLVVPRSAAGHTEWYRGVAEAAIELLHAQSQLHALPLHTPLRAWLRQRFEAWSDRLYDSTGQLLAAIEYERHNLPAALQSGRAERALREILDLYHALGIELQPLLPAPVWRFYQDGGALRFGPGDAPI